jgi:hypothetical protein
MQDWLKQNTNPAKIRIPRLSNIYILEEGA